MKHRSQRTRRCERSSDSAACSLLKHLAPSASYQSLEFNHLWLNITCSIGGQLFLRRDVRDFSLREKEIFYFFKVGKACLLCLLRKFFRFGNKIFFFIQIKSDTVNFFYKADVFLNISTGQVWFLDFFPIPKPKTQNSLKFWNCKPLQLILTSKFHLLIRLKKETHN